MTACHPLRLSPLPAEEWDDGARSALASLIPPERTNPHGAGNVLSTLVRHPALAAAYVPFNAYLLRGSTLSQRTREVAVLRVVHRRDCDYLWSHHLPIARNAGLSAEDIERIRSGQPDNLQDRLVVQATDDLGELGTISNRTWDHLSSHFSDQQRMDLVFTIGGYYLLALAVNTFGVQGETTS